MNTGIINRKEILSTYTGAKNPVALQTFVSYVIKMDNEKDKEQKLKNPFMQKLSNEKLIELYKRVESEGLEFDGKHITIQSTGISYDYVAYKNRMLLAYPETLVDCQLVYEGDEFSVQKDSGQVVYSHKIKNPFGKREIIGGYCVIKNKRGEFLTTLNKEDFEKHRKVAKTDFIWKQWYEEMCLKTLMKKAVRVHFDDIYSAMDKEEENHYDLEKLNEENKDKWRKRSVSNLPEEAKHPMFKEWSENIDKLTTKGDIAKYVSECNAETLDDAVHAKLVLCKKESLTN